MYTALVALFLVMESSRQWLPTSLLVLTSCSLSIVIKWSCPLVFGSFSLLISLLSRSSVLFVEYSQVP
jgi:hypothetical protein